jgi:hypothetical protein
LQPLQCVRLSDSFVSGFQSSPWITKSPLLTTRLCVVRVAVVSSIAPAYWIRWMLVSENYDESQIHLARMAPARYYQQPHAFGFTAAPTRFGDVNFTLQQTAKGGLHGTMSLRRRQGVVAGSVPVPVVTVRLSSGVVGKPFSCVQIHGGAGSGPKLLAWHPANETAWVALGQVTEGGTGVFELSAPC